MMTRFPFDPGAITLEQAREWLEERKEKGMQCPCCLQFAKIYKRKLNSSMARGLITLYRFAKAHPDQEALHIPSIFRDKKVCSSNDGALLRHWGLIVSTGGIRKDGSKRVGHYHLTPLGVKFALKSAAVPAYAVLFNEELIRLEGEQTTIEDALRKKFSYDELMSK
jgi:hypothetical protein